MPWGIGEAFTKFSLQDSRSFIAVRRSVLERPVSFSSSVLMAMRGLTTRRLASDDHRSSFPAGSSWRETCPVNAKRRHLTIYVVENRRAICWWHDILYILLILVSTDALKTVFYSFIDWSFPFQTLWRELIALQTWPTRVFVSYPDQYIHLNTWSSRQVRLVIHRKWRVGW